MAAAIIRFTLETSELQEWCFGCSHNTIPAQMRHRWCHQNARIVTWLQPEHDSCADAASLAKWKCRNRALAAATTRFMHRWFITGKAGMQGSCPGCSHSTIPTQMLHQWESGNAGILPWLQPQRDSCPNASRLAQRKCRNPALAEPQRDSCPDASSLAQRTCRNRALAAATALFE